MRIESLSAAGLQPLQPRETQPLLRRQSLATLAGISPLKRRIFREALFNSAGEQKWAIVSGAAFVLQQRHAVLRNRIRALLYDESAVSLRTDP